MKKHIVYVCLWFSAASVLTASAGEKDREFDNGSKISHIKLTASKTDDLAVLGKV